MPSSSFAPVITASGTLDEAFPDVDPNLEPLGSLVLLQIRLAKKTTGNKITTPTGKVVELEIDESTRSAIQQNTQVAKVLGWGPLAFCNRNTGQPWPEGAWVKAGDFVRVPRYGGDRWEVRHGDDVVMFLLMKDLELPGRIPRPLDVVSYV